MRQLAAQQELSLRQLPTRDPAAAAWQLSAGGRRLLVMQTHDRLRLEHYGQGSGPQHAQQWAAEAHGAVSRQQLQQAVQELCGVAAT